MTPIVAIGASAGGLEQVSQLLRDLPDDTGAAFVVLQHLDPEHNSQLTDLLGRVTALPVVTLEDGMPIEPDRVHVNPPGHSLGIRDDRFHLTRDVDHENVPTLIDRFFRSLAAARTTAAVGVILSGTGSDGALGLKAIKAEGGLILAQDPDSAAHDGMPRAAIRASVVDYIADTPALVQPLINHLRLNFKQGAGQSQRERSPTNGPDSSDILSDEQLETILALLRKHEDRASFATYKPNMLKRRIQRRMGLNGIKQVTEYQRLLEGNKSERVSLSRDFLISVTDFFREPHTYESLRETAIRSLLKDRDASEPIRVWAPGCATGEEAYSIAILLAEEIEASGQNVPFTLFATDIDQRALDTARAGLYPDSVVADVTESRLRRFFDRIDSHYQVKRFVREQVVFASQNVVEDPPYSRLDLISCRHLLMYLKPTTQQRVLAMFHFALKRTGYLFLGNSETVGDQIDLFEPVVKEARVFRRIGPGRRSRADVPFAYHAGAGLAVASSNDVDTTQRPDNAEQIARDILLKEHVPAAILINRKYEILCSYGPTRDYLSLPFGGASLGLMEMVHDELRSHVRAVTHHAFRDDGRHEATAPVRDHDRRTVQIVARQLHHPQTARGLVLVTFEHLQRPARATRSDQPESDLNQQLADELESTRSELHSTIQALEASNEDLKGSNEEILSMNAELQSTNEELETSKEELQSLNEELTTVNGELEHKVAELETAHNDLNNLFLGTQVATLFLDRSMGIKRFTPTIKELLSLITSDIGRPLGDITLKFNDPELMADAEATIEQLEVREKEVQAHNGRWYQRRVLPYRTHDNTINGVVITFADITDLKRAWLATRESEQRLDMAMSAINGGMWEMQIDPDQPNQLPDTIYLSARLKQLIGFEDHQLAHSLSAWQERIVAEDRAAFADVVQRQSEAHAHGLHYRIRHRNGELRWFASFGTIIRNEDDDNARWIGIDCDITDLKQSDIETQQAQSQLRLLADALPALVVFVDHQRIVQFTNTAYNEWFGTASDQVIGQPVDQALEAHAYNTIEPCIDTALGGKAVTCELELEHPRHGPRTLQVEHMPHVMYGQVLGFFALMTNITNHKRRKVDQLTQQSNLVYVHRLATVGEMASTLAHDLSQPLSAINAYAGALTRMLHNAKPADETTPLLGKIADQVDRASYIIRQTRDFVGHRDHGRDTVDVNELVNAAIALMDGRAKKMNVEIRLDMHTALSAVNGYRVQIEQVLINLINNAFDAMEDIDDDKRVLWLTTETADAGYIRIVITDSGAGIAADKITTIFDAFHTTKLEGMGMGLAISRSIAQWHGGQLWAESRDGHGASFYLKLPIAQEHQDAG